MKLYESKVGWTLVTLWFFIFAWYVFGFYPSYGTDTDALVIVVFSLPWSSLFGSLFFSNPSLSHYSIFGAAVLNAAIIGTALYFLGYGIQRLWEKRKTSQQQPPQIPPQT